MAQVRRITLAMQRRVQRPEVHVGDQVFVMSEGWGEVKSVSPVGVEVLFDVDRRQAGKRWVSAIRTQDEAHGVTCAMSEIQVRG